MDGLGVPNLMGLALAGYALYTVATIVHTLFLSPLRHIPGPFLAKFTRLWELQAVRRTDFNLACIQLHAQYGTCTDTLRSFVLV